MKDKYQITVLNERSRRIVYRPIVVALQTLLELYKAPKGEVVVLITDNERIRQTNLDFRQIDEATDVLSFPAPSTALGHIGDIVLSLDFAEKQAKIRGVRVIDEAAMLAVHGGLHLLGFDDQTDYDRDDMVRRMNEVMQKAGLPVDNDWYSLPHSTSPGANR